MSPKFRLNIIWILLLVGIASGSVISGCWRAPFYQVDDHYYEAVAATTPWTSIFTTRPANHFPLTFLSLKLDYVLFCSNRSIPPSKVFSRDEGRDWSTGARLMNAVYHGVAGILLFFLLRRLSRSDGLAAFVALAWTVHPAACESVCWVVERKNVLAALFGFAALLSWTISNERWWRIPLAALLYLCAMLSKVSVLGLMPIFVLMELLLTEEKARFNHAGKRSWVTKLERLSPILAVFAFGFWLSKYAFPFDAVSPPGGTVWTAILTDFSIFDRYLLNTFVPTNLSFYYAVHPITSLLSIRFWLCSIFLLSFCLLLPCLCMGRARRLCIFGVLWFFSALAPNANLIASAFPMQDRFIYLSMPGLLLAVGLAIRSIPKLNTHRFALPAIASMYILVLLVFTCIRSPQFVSGEVLAIDAAQRQPGSAFANVAAAEAFKELTLKHLPSGESPNFERARIYSHAAVEHYGAAEKCEDIRYFADRLQLATNKAELLMAVNDFVPARQILHGMLPPQDMQMLPENPTEILKVAYRRDLYYAFYRRETLAHAWAVLGEGSLAEAQSPKLPAEQQTSILERGLAEATNAFNVRPTDAAQILKARLLLRYAKIAADQKNVAMARERYDSAIVLLKSIPPTSAGHASAQLLMTVARP